MFSKLLPCAILSIAATTPALAQGVARDTARTSPIVVTATRSPLAAGRAPSAVTVITGEQLRRTGITAVGDALGQVPGLAVVQSGSYGGATSLFIRGGESKHAKVLVDGVPVNDAGGAFDFSSLTTDNVERIEIVRGPASVLYGSDAMAGVVQLFTRRGDGRPRIELGARGGGNSSYDAHAAVRGGAMPLDYSFGVSRHATDGFQAFNSASRTTVGSASVGTRAERYDARLTARYIDGSLHFPTDGAGQVVDSNSAHHDGRLSVGVDAGYQFTGVASLHLALASLDVHGLSENLPDGPGDTGGYYFTTGDRSRRRSGDLRLDIELPAAARLSVGAQVEREWQESVTASNYGDDAFTARRRTSGAYTQLLLSPDDRYTATFGARLEHNEEFGDFATWRSAASVLLRPGTRLRGSLGTAFREPTFLENFGGAYAIGNPALSPEHAVSADAGVQQKLGDDVTVEVTWFANSFRDLIDYRYSATEPNYFNLARTRSAGMELQGRAALPAGFHADAAFTYLETRVVDAGASSAVTALFAPGARLLRRPMHTLDAGAGWRSSRAGLDLRAHRLGTREDNYYAPDFSTQHVTLPPYTRLDLSADAAVPVATAVRATLRAENLLDARYTDVAGFNYDFSRTDAASLARTGYRAAGRRVLVGARWTL